MSEVSVPISVGELIDKITILEIKAERIGDAGKLANVRKELDLLNATWAATPYEDDQIAKERQALRDVNGKLWDIEDDIRDKERAGEFDEEFVRLARSVYYTNDKRAAIKREINVKVGSDLVEEKSYADYGDGGDLN